MLGRPSAPEVDPSLPEAAVLPRTTRTVPADVLDERALRRLANDAGAARLSG